MIDEFLKRPHPALVHFPITFFPASLVFLMIFWVTHNAFFLHASYWSFMFGALMTIPVAITGWHDMDRAKANSEKASSTLHFHAVNGVLITGISVLTGIIFLWRPPMEYAGLFPLFVLVSIALSLLVLLQGAVGGMIVYRYRVGIDPEGRSSSSSH